MWHAACARHGVTISLSLSQGTLQAQTFSMLVTAPMTGRSTARRAFRDLYAVRQEDPVCAIASNSALSLQRGGRMGKHRPRDEAGVQSKYVWMAHSVHDASFVNQCFLRAGSEKEAFLSSLTAPALMLM